MESRLSQADPDSFYSCWATLAWLLDLGIRQAHEHEARQPVGQVQLDGHLLRLQAIEGAAVDDGEGHASHHACALPAPAMALAWAARKSHKTGARRANAGPRKHERLASDRGSPNWRTGMVSAYGLRSDFRAFTSTEKPR
jgi:hypothetical protein